MSQSYQRYQIILTETSPELSAHGKKAFGKCILEAKNGSGKVSLSVQNLKSGAACNAYIIAVNGEAPLAINIGKLSADTSGHAQLKWQCSASNVDNSTLELKDFVVVALCVGSSISNTGLVGYRDKEIAWKNDLRVHSKNPPSVENAPLQSTVAAETEITIPISETPPEPEPTSTTLPSFLTNYEIPTLTECPYAEPEEFFELMEEGPAERALKDVAEHINEKLNEIDALAYQPLATEPLATEPLATETAATETLADKSLDAAEPLADKPLTTEEVPLESPILAALEQNHLHNIFHNFSRIRPFKFQDANEEWVRITPNEISFLPGAFSHLQSEPRVLEAYRKFNHLILGRKSHGEHVDIAFGMPDIYAICDEESVKTAGFLGFQSCDSEEAKETKHGYWLRIVTYSN